MAEGEGREGGKEGGGEGIGGRRKDELGTLVWGGEMGAFDGRDIGESGRRGRAG